ncbi:universal stress protein [Amycolatopsis orientalis]|uniref:universal stress protein n=1 Tax=Amycolatopsis orientalis TaxID=31958 RepID=UPI00041535C6|nr:universal stress protein [Amycolatopsis orientalis]
MPRHTHTPLCGSRDRIVVGVDESPESVSALRWAAAEARLRHTHLHVVHSHPEGTEGVDLDKVLKLAFTSPPPVEIESLSVAAKAPETLVAASHGAALLVVGSHAHGAFAEVFRSVAWRSVAFATCPVAVVPSGDTFPEQTHGRVVVGVEDSFSARDALWWAANETLFRSIGGGRCVLHVVHVAAPTVLIPRRLPPAELIMDATATAGELTGPERLLRSLATEILTGPLAKVEVLFEIRQGDSHERTGTVTGTLGKLAREADLLVVGARGYGVFSDALSMSITSGALHGARCPVVVAPDTREDSRGRIRTATLAMEHELARGGAVRW